MLHNRRSAAKQFWDKGRAACEQQCGEDEGRGSEAGDPVAEPAGRGGSEWVMSHNVLENLHMAGCVNSFLLKNQHFALDASACIRRIFILRAHASKEAREPFPPRTPDHGHRLARWSARPLRRFMRTSPTRRATPQCALLARHSRGQGPSPLRARWKTIRWYEPVTPREDVSRNALRRLLTTFFDNSAANLVATLLDPAERKLDAEEIARLESLLAQYRPRKRSKSSR